MTKTPAEVVRELLERALPFLQEAAEPFEDDGGNEPLELAREIESALEEGSIAALSAPQGEVVAAVEVFRIAGGDVECCPNPTAEQAMECLRDLRECYNESLAAPPPKQAEQGPNRQIDELLQEYEMQGWTTADAAKVAQRYVSTMPDSQVRCLLHILATPPQQREGGKVRVTKQMCHAAIDAYTEAVGEGWQMPCVHGMYAALDAVFAQAAQQPGEVAGKPRIVGVDYGSSDRTSFAINCPCGRLHDVTEAIAALTTGGRNG